MHPSLGQIPNSTSKKQLNRPPYPQRSLPTKTQQNKRMLSVSSSCGLPICLNGISRPLPFSQELEDHERRRESMKRKKFQEFLQLHEMITREASGHGSDNCGGGVVKTEFYPCISLPSTAKAA